MIVQLCWICILHPSKYEMLFEQWIGLKPNPVLAEELGEEDKVCYLNSYISPGGRISGEVLTRIQKIR